MTDKEFCDMYSAFYGDSGKDKMTKPEQLTFQRFNGRDLKEFADHIEKQSILNFMNWYAGDEHNKLPRDLNEIIKIYHQ